MAPYKNPSKSLQGAVNRANGKWFEEYLEMALRYYSSKGIAEIQKTPEPMRPLRSMGGGRFIACFTGKAQPDFKGTLRGGRTVIFDAKYTGHKYIDKSAVTQNQADLLDRYAKMGAWCFILAALGNGTYYRVPWEIWRTMETITGFKRMTEADLVRYRVPIAANGMPLILG